MIKKPTAVATAIFLNSIWIEVGIGIEDQANEFELWLHCLCICLCTSKQPYKQTTKKPTFGIRFGASLNQSHRVLREANDRSQQATQLIVLIKVLHVVRHNLFLFLFLYLNLNLFCVLDVFCFCFDVFCFLFLVFVFEFLFCFVFWFWLICDCFSLEFFLVWF